ncbi:hypothetical protein BDV93DRAFT_544284 [Ceratobasidium sp. AG-I]|nr:hypothetical protein BDV93DRAFT_544284 [Ceratobasidium sp. AG-I]
MDFQFNQLDEDLNLSGTVVSQRPPPGSPELCKPLSSIRRDGIDLEDGSPLTLTPFSLASAAFRDLLTNSVSRALLNRVPLPVAAPSGPYPPISSVRLLNGARACNTYAPRWNQVRLEENPLESLERPHKRYVSRIEDLPALESGGDGVERNVALRFYFNRIVLWIAGGLNWDVDLAFELDLGSSFRMDFRVCGSFWIILAITRLCCEG